MDWHRLIHNYSDNLADKDATLVRKKINSCHVGSSEDLAKDIARYARQSGFADCAVLIYPLIDALEFIAMKDLSRIPGNLPHEEAREALRQLKNMLDR